MVSEVVLWSQMLQKPNWASACASQKNFLCPIEYRTIFGWKWFQMGSYTLLSLGEMVSEVDFYLDAIRFATAFGTMISMFIWCLSYNIKISFCFWTNLEWKWFQIGSCILLSLGEMVSEVDFYLNATPDAQKQQNVLLSKMTKSHKKKISYRILDHLWMENGFK